MIVPASDNQECTTSIINAQLAEIHSPVNVSAEPSLLISCHQILGQALNETDPLDDIMFSCEARSKTRKRDTPVNWTA